MRLAQDGFASWLYIELCIEHGCVVLKQKKADHPDAGYDVVSIHPKNVPDVVSALLELPQDTDSQHVHGVQLRRSNKVYYLDQINISGDTLNTLVIKMLALAEQAAQHEHKGKKS